MKDKLRIAITLPYLFSVRDFLCTPVWDEMAKRSNVHFIFLSHDDNVRREVEDRGCSNISFLSFPPKVNEKKSLLRRIFSTRIFNVLDILYLSRALNYRFSAINNLAHYRVRKAKSKSERRRQRVFSDYRLGEAAGFPFPRSLHILRFIYELSYGFFNRPKKEDLDFLSTLGLDLFVFGRINMSMNAYWAGVLRARSVPMLGIVSSWDHPTTKGPVPRGMSGYIVASSRMVDEMVGLHKLKRDKVLSIGKVQMDLFSNNAVLGSREDFLSSIGIAPGSRLVTFGTNAVCLKDHEVSVARRLARDFSEGRYGNTVLLLRTHPQDNQWEKDFAALATMPGVICINACSFGDKGRSGLSEGLEDQVFFAKLMRHSDLVIQSRGSLALDAIAFDTPVISIAFDGELERTPEDSILREYEAEHYKPIVAACGTWMAGSFESLDRGIKEYLKDPGIHSKGRGVVRKEQVEPFDGLASKRLIDYIVDSAEKARRGTLAEGDWDYSGYGDLKWSAHQSCDVISFVDE